MEGAGSNDFLWKIFSWPTRHAKKKKKFTAYSTLHERFSMPTLLRRNMFYNRMNVQIVQIFRLCERVIKVVNFWRKFPSAHSWLLIFFSMPTLWTSKYFRCLLTFYPAKGGTGGAQNKWETFWSCGGHALPQYWPKKWGLFLQGWGPRHPGPRPRIRPCVLTTE